MKTIQSKPLALVIEDNDSLIDIFTQAMKIAGFKIESVADGLQAIDKLANLEPAVIILDLYLPGTSGESILKYIHNETRLNKAVIVLTTFDSLMADNLREQCDFVLVKPVSFSQLRDLGINYGEPSFEVGFVIAWIFRLYRLTGLIANCEQSSFNRT